MTEAKRSKYNNRRTEYKGMKFDSQAELRRWKQLEDMQERGEIEGLARQVRYALWSCEYFADHDAPATRIKVCDYVADAVYWRVADDAGTLEWVVEDCKGKTAPLTDIFRLKMKLFRANYGYDVLVVRV